MKENPYKKLSKKYREKGKANLSASEVEAYIQGRMPATRSVVKKVFNEIHGRIHCTVKNFLDIGAGPGTGLLAAQEVFPEIESALLVEENMEMVRRGKKLVDAQWVNKSADQVEFPKVDLTLFAYSYGEIESLEILRRAWEASQVLVIIEPGTPRGFAKILEAREHLICWGAEMIAPCPHARECPMNKSQKWCHFSERVTRSKQHRELKEGSLGWEDEKYSYVAFANHSITMTSARVVGVPRKRTGHVLLELCTEAGLEDKAISKKEKEQYKKARKLNWGDSFDPYP